MKNIFKNKFSVFAANLFLTAVSLFLSVPIAEGLCKATVESISEGRYANYLFVITDEIFLFAFLFFTFDGIFGILRFHHLYDKELFLKRRKNEVMLLTEALRVAASPEFAAEAALSAAACHFSHGLGALHFALLLATLVFRKAAVRRRWYIERNKSAGKNFVSALKSFVSLAFQFALSLYLLPIALPFLWVIVAQYRAIAKIVFFVSLIFSLYIHIRALKKRNDFIKKFRVLCEEKGFELSEIKHKFSFIFGRKSGANFTVSAHGKTYSCKFIGAKIFGTPIIFKPCGDGCFHYIFKMRGTPIINKRAYFEYGFEADENERKILICSPLPIKMSLEEKGHSLTLSSGSPLWEYKVFGASNFLRCLEWDALEK